MKGVLELINNESTMNTDPTPNIPEMSPAKAGRMNWPNRLPASRMLMAKERSSSRLILETQAIVIGCPTPREKPATNMTIPSKIGVLA